MYTLEVVAIPNLGDDSTNNCTVIRFHVILKHLVGLDGHILKLLPIGQHQFTVEVSAHSRVVHQKLADQIQTSAVSVSNNELAGTVVDVCIDRVRLIVINNIPDDTWWNLDGKLQQLVEQSHQLISVG